MQELNDLGLPYPQTMGGKVNNDPVNKKAGEYLREVKYPTHPEQLNVLNLAMWMIEQHKSIRSLDQPVLILLLESSPKAVMNQLFPKEKETEFLETETPQEAAILVLQQVSRLTQQTQHQVDSVTLLDDPPMETLNKLKQMLNTSEYRKNTYLL